MRRLLALFVLAVAAEAMQARPPVPPDALASRGGNLEIGTAKLEGKDIILTSSLVTTVYQKRVETRKIDGKEEQVVTTVAVPVQTQRMSKASLKDVQAFTGDGKPLSPEALAVRLKQSTPVLTTYGGWIGKEVPFRGLLRDDAIVLLLPTPESEQVPELKKER